MTIRAIIVDDEPLARRGLELRLRDAPDIEIVRQCANGREALAAIAELHPDLMFLDVHMPGLSGVDVLKQVPQESLPMIVFVTAYDRFAIDAFEAHALDYLLKPVDESRLAQALDRVRAQWQQRQALAQREQLMAMLADLTGKGEIDPGATAASGGATSGPPARSGTWSRTPTASRAARRWRSSAAAPAWCDRSPRSAAINRSLSTRSQKIFSRLAP